MDGLRERNKINSVIKRDKYIESDQTEIQFTDRTLYKWTTYRQAHN